MEDKRIGPWFIKNHNGTFKATEFADKVLVYLWNDAFKFSRNAIFPDYDTFEELQEDFIGEKKFKIFSTINFNENTVVNIDEESEEQQ